MDRRRRAAHRHAHRSRQHQHERRVDAHQDGSALTTFHHVANGTATTDLIGAAGIPGSWSIWADPLHEGPVPAGLSDDELIDLRAGYLGGSPGDAVSPHAVRADTPPDAVALDGVNDLRGWRRAIERGAYDELVLWFEHDLFDQLNLIQLLDWIRSRGLTSRTISLICIGSFPGRPGFKGLGELTPAELGPLVETRRRVTQAQFAVAQEAWQAFREPTPEALDRLRGSDTSALPFLASALTRFLQEYPWTTDGLSRTERRLLALADPGPMNVRRAFPRMHDDEDAYYVTDRSFDALIDELSRVSPPLLTVGGRVVSGDGAAVSGIMKMEITTAVTAVGRAVLKRERDRVAMCGLDRWLGGVHLQPGAAAWRWDPTGGRVVKV